MTGTCIFILDHCNQYVIECDWRVKLWEIKTSLRYDVIQIIATPSIVVPYVKMLRASYQYFITFCTYMVICVCVCVYPLYDVHRVQINHFVIEVNIEYCDLLLYFLVGGRFALWWSAFINLLISNSNTLKYSREI